jgi:hypothetical protein
MKLTCEPPWWASMSVPQLVLLLACALSPAILTLAGEARSGA